MKAGQAALAQGSFLEAEQAFKGAVSQAEKSKSSADLSSSLCALAQTYHAYAFYDKAEPLYKRALSIRQKMGPKTSLPAAAVLKELGNLARAKGNTPQSLEFYQQALSLAKSALGPGHPDVVAYQLPPAPEDFDPATLFPSLAVNLNALADLQRAAGNVKEAEALYNNALATAESKADTEDAIIVLNNLGDLFRAEGRLAEAEATFAKAISLAKNEPPDRLRRGGVSLNSMQQNLVASLNNLADFHRAQGQLAKSESLYRQALEIGERTLGVEDADIGLTLNNLADLLGAQGKTYEAESLYKKAKDIGEKAVTASELDVSTYKSALAIDEEILGRWHPDVAMDLNNLADAYRAHGNYTEAEPLYRRALAIAERAFGPNNPDVARSLNNLADLYREQGRFSDAEPLYRRSLQVVAQAAAPPDLMAGTNVAVSGETSLPESLDITSELNKLADLYRAKGRYIEAEALYLRAISLAQKAGETAKPSAIVSLSNLADLYNSQGKQDEAAKLALRVKELKGALGSEPAVSPKRPE